MLPCCKTVIYSVWNCAMIHYTAPYWLHLITFSGRKSRDKKLRLCLDVSQFKKFFLPPNCDWHGFLCKSFNPFSWLRQTLVLYKKKDKAQMDSSFFSCKGVEAEIQIVFMSLPMPGLLTFVCNFLIWLIFRGASIHCFINAIHGEQNQTELKE